MKFMLIEFGGFVKSPILLFSVIPAKAGIQEIRVVLDSRFHGSDAFMTFYEDVRFG